MNTMRIACLDLEGVLIPEIWQKIARTTKIHDLRLTTRDIPDYHELMQHRLLTLQKHKISIRCIREIISTIEPLPGAQAFLQSLRNTMQVIILSDTFIEFMDSILPLLQYPTLFCNYLTVNESGYITAYHLRQEDGKYKAIQALSSINYEIYAAGDSYNDISMIRASQKGALFCPPESIQNENQDIPVCKTYTDLLEFFVCS